MSYLFCLFKIVVFVVVQLLSCVRLFATSWTEALQVVFHCLPKFAQTHVHWVGDAIQSSHPLSSSYPPAFNPSQLQGLFQWIGSLDQVAKVLELQHQSFQWIFRLDFLWGFWRLWSLCCPKDSQESSPAPQFESINFSAFSLFYGPTLTSVYDSWKNHSFD